MGLKVQAGRSRFWVNSLLRILVIFGGGEIGMNFNFQGNI